VANKNLQNPAHEKHAGKSSIAGKILLIFFPQPNFHTTSFLTRPLGFCGKKIKNPGVS